MSKIKLKRFFSNPVVVDYAFLLLGLNDVNKVIEQVQSQINRNDLYKPEDSDYGLETETHVTIVPCMNNDVDRDFIKAQVPELSNFKIEVVDAHIFECDEYDVLVIKVDSEALRKLNEKICGLVPTSSQYDYNPHVTVAYFNKGEAKKYKDLLKSKLGELELQPNKFIISWHEGGMMEQLEWM